MILIHHNPRCSKSRQTLALIQEAGFEAEVNLYLDTGWTKSQLQDMFADAGLTPRDALRNEQGLTRELGLLDKDATDTAILDAMVAHPKLVNRPFVITPNGTRLCRPPERVLEVLGKT